MAAKKIRNSVHARMIKLLRRLIERGFFDVPKSIEEIRTEGESYGENHLSRVWSSVCLELVRNMELRRSRKSKKDDWKYQKP